MNTLPASLLNASVEIDGRVHRLADLVRKQYRVEVSNDGIIWDDQHDATIFEFSEAANERAESHRSAGLQSCVIVHSISNAPKKAFWELWRDDGGKKLLKKAGVHITKQGESFVITEKAVTKSQIIRSKGYGRRRSYDEMSGEERNMYWTAMKDAQDFYDEPATYRKEVAHVKAVFLGGPDPYDKDDCPPSRPKPRAMKTPETVEVCDDLAD